MADAWPRNDYRIIERTHQLSEDAARDLGYTLARGAYSGTTDDRLDRWYVECDDDDVIDHRGPGYPCKKDALEGLREAPWTAARCRGGRRGRSPAGSSSTSSWRRSAANADARAEIRAAWTFTSQGLREVVVVEWMPQALRETHVAAGNRGAWPLNGSTRLVLKRECAARLVASDAEWAEIIEHEEPREYVEVEGSPRARYSSKLMRDPLTTIAPDPLQMHADALGALCVDDGSGCCAVCAVALVPCDTCEGVGYHRDGCAQIEDECPALPASEELGG